jgi:hypothetical protein
MTMAPDTRAALIFSVDLQRCRRNAVSKPALQRQNSNEDWRTMPGDDENYVYAVALS